jgi:hypothetical protein
MPNGATTADRDETTQNLIEFLKDRPKRFTIELYYREVPELFEFLIERGFLPNPTIMKSGPSRTLMEYDLTDGWRVNLTIPPEFNGDRDNRVTVIEFLGPGDPSHPHTIKAEDFSQSPAFPARYVYAEPRRAA